MTVLAGFPGVGKTYAANVVDAIDSDSSAFSWESPGVRHPAWPHNYIERILVRESQGRTIFVSTHEEVRAGLAAEGIPFTLVYPARNLRNEYVARLSGRGSPPSMVDFVNSNWAKLVDSCWRQGGCEHVVLRPGQYLTDVLTSGSTQTKDAPIASDMVATAGGVRFQPLYRGPSSGAENGRPHGQEQGRG